VPLLYQQSSCAITKAVVQTNWRGYGLHHPKGALPIAPMAILVHVALSGCLTRRSPKRRSRLIRRF
jgi:DNA topoisomerase VI subunit B